MIRDLLPPIIYKILHKIKSKFSSRVSPSEEKSYQSYEEALEDCTKNGYEDDQLTDVILFKTINYAKTLENNYLKLTPTTSFSLSALASIVSAKASNLTVVDVGGACGAHYFEFRKACDPSLSIRNHSLPPPEMPGSLDFWFRGRGGYERLHLFNGMLLKLLLWLKKQKTLCNRKNFILQIA